MARNRAGDNEQERNLYELNARNIITTWGDKNNNLHDYAQRQYGGMMGDFNYTRWKIYLDAISKALHGNGKFNGGATEAAIRNYEDKWVHSQNDYPTKAQGDPIAIARKIKAKYVTVEK